MWYAYIGDDINENDNQKIIEEVREKSISWGKHWYKYSIEIWGSFSTNLYSEIEILSSMRFAYDRGTLMRERILSRNENKR